MKNMISSNENGMVMPVSPMYGGGYGGGFGNGGDWWGILLLIALLNGGFGGFGGWGGMGMMGMADGIGIYPWMNQANLTTSGFDHAATQSQLGDIHNSITSGFGDVSTQLCGGFAGVTAAVTGAQNAVSQQLYTNQIADLERSFAAQTASSQGMNAIQSQLAQCCCDNRLGTESLRATVLQENCADRYEASNNTRDIIDSQTRSTQAILDKLCALELDGVKGQLAQAQRDNAALQNQINMANMQIGFNNETDALYNRLKNCPVPSVPVYGSQPVFTCGNNGVGCGCGGSF